MKNVLLSARDVCKAFRAEKTNLILNHVDADIYEGDFTVIMGASGAGKSTLLYALSGMDRITDGRVIYKEKELSRMKEKEMAALRAEEFGFVFQQTHLVSNLTLLENVKVAGFLLRFPEARHSGPLLQERLSISRVSCSRMNPPGR